MPETRYGPIHSGYSGTAPPQKRQKPKSRYVSTRDDVGRGKEVAFCTVKLVPWNVTGVPPATTPDEGEIREMVGTMTVLNSTVGRPVA
eukprot:2216056-Rhodomonas_salina.1